MWHHCLLLWHWKMHSDQSLERWIWPISCRKCWCTPSRSDCSRHSFHFSLLWDEGKHRHVAHKAACMGEKKWERSLIFYQLGCPTTYKRGIHRKCEEGTFLGSFMAINQRHPRAKPRGIWMEEGHSKQDTMPHFFTRQHKTSPWLHFGSYQMWMQNWYTLQHQEMQL